MENNRADVICLKKDVELFLASGFVLSRRSAGRGQVRLVHNDSDRAFDSLVTLMAEKRSPFVARIGRTKAWGVRTLAFAGNRLVLIGSPAPPPEEVQNDLRV